MKACKSWQQETIVGWVSIEAWKSCHHENICLGVNSGMAIMPTGTKCLSAIGGMEILQTGTQCVGFNEGMESLLAGNKTG